MSTTDVDIAVVGAGPAGLASTCLLAQGGARVALVNGAAAAQADPRTIALMRPSIRLLEHLGLWSGTLQAEAAPLRRLKLVDDTGSLLEAPTVTFDAAELDLDAFGWNVPLALLLPALSEAAIKAGARLIEDLATGTTLADRSIAIRLASGVTLAARAAIAADGRNSKLRSAAGIATRQWSYDQTAIATSFGHSAPHRDVSTEYHRSAGPFTTVPLPGQRSSLVWMERPDRADKLTAMDETDFAAEIQVATHGQLGKIGGIGPRKAFPMRGLTASRFAARRIFLIGEAAHAGPPIGAQGLNMSLRDAALAAELILSSDDPGGASVLDRYSASRLADVTPRQAMIDLLNRSLITGFVALEAGRALGLWALQSAGPLRRTVMQRGLTPASGLPQAMQG